MTFEKGYAERCGERGCRLSGGELQRLAIARAVIRKPDILLLDEATSSIDSVTESFIQDSLDQLCKGKTTFVIAHRLSTILKADQILVIDKGKIMESGTHNELLAKKAAYHKLWTTQLKLQSDAKKESEAATGAAGLTLVNDLDADDKEGADLIKVTSTEVQDAPEAAAVDRKLAEADEQRPQTMEETVALDSSRGRQNVRERVKSINQQNSASPSPQREKSGKHTVLMSQSPTRSRLKGSAPEFIPNILGRGQSDGTTENRLAMPARPENGAKENEGRQDRRRAESEPVSRNSDNESEETATSEEENEKGKYSRIPKRNR
jgi:ABC-type multidrug transport system ATPase subunit